MPSRDSGGFKCCVRPGPGTVTIRARITYNVTFWANGYTERLANYTWSSPPATYQSGELSDVNTNN